VLVYHPPQVTRIDSAPGARAVEALGRQRDSSRVRG
jgi:hypothetical protein